LNKLEFSQPLFFELTKDGFIYQVRIFPALITVYDSETDERAKIALKIN
jgi:hypothetical protein